MDLNTLFEILRDVFMSLFIIIFIIDIFSKRSFKIQYYVAIAFGVIFSALTWEWSIGFKVVFIALFVILAINAISDVRKRKTDINADV